MKIYFGSSVGRTYEPDFINCVIQLLKQAGTNGHAIYWRPQCNDALVSRSRSVAASKFLESDADVFLSIDTDIVFRAEDAVSICERAVKVGGVVVGLYKTRSEDRGFSTTLLPIGTSVESTVPGLVPVRWAATGFMAVSRSAFERLAEELPRCHPSVGWAFYPFFMPFVAPAEDGELTYLSEDYAMCERAARAGIPIYCDPSIRLGHVGPYCYAFPDEPWKLTRLDEPGVHYRLDIAEALAPATTEMVGSNERGRRT